ncbi:pilus assembly protein [Pseudoxanthomonas beigongshangi]
MPARACTRSCWCLRRPARIRDEPASTPRELSGPGCKACIGGPVIPCPGIASMISPIILSLPESPLHRRAQRMFPAVGAFLITLLCAPVQAGINDVPIPDRPLNTGQSVAPNLMLLLDNSRSMSDVWMKDLTDIRTATINGWSVKLHEEGRLITPTANRLAYDPRRTYRPWVDLHGNYLEDMDPASTYSDPNLTISTIPQLGALGTAESPRISLYTRTHPFYVPQPDITDLQDLSQYRLYWLGKDVGRACTTAELGENGHYWAPTTHMSLPKYPQGKCKDVTEFTWVTQDGETIQRTLDQEWRNYANWYGYHRTRMKVTKAALSYAFSALDQNYRVGYSRLGLDVRIWNDYWKQDPIRVNSPTGGLFTDVVGKDPEGSLRSIWFAQLFAERGTLGSTPVHGPLQAIGKYYSRADANGPWGPGTPDRQAACRKNYTILVTDGAWNAISGDYQYIRNADGMWGPTHLAPDGSSWTYLPRPPFKDAYPDTMADLAMHYWKHDLRPDLPNVVPTTPEDPAFWQHMSMFTVSIGIKGKLDPVADLPNLISGVKQWPFPGEIYESYKIDDLFHAAVNGRGKYVSAVDPNGLNEAMTDILGIINERTASSTRLSVNGGRLQAGLRGYVASYSTGKWSGDLVAYPIKATGSGAGPGGAVIWRASEGIPEPATRLILTHGEPDTRDRAVAARPFPITQQEQKLDALTVAWLRGDRSAEGSRLRERDHVLGDIVHSDPVHVKTADAEVVLAGANDGMLHAFDAATGKEVFAYVPGLLDMDRLKGLARRTGFRHRYFVDGPLTVQRSHRGGNDVSIIGTLGRGGRGLYALSLDLARPGEGAKSWEYTDDSDMGMVLAPAQVHRIAGVANDVVLVPNGINSASGKAALYVLDAATGQVVRKLAAGEDLANGLSALTAVDSNRDGVVDKVYAGDIRGNVWQFDLSARPSDEGTVRRVFTATDASGKHQPITGGIGVAYHPATQRPWVFFGTGSYITSADATDVSIQSWYGVEVEGEGEVQQPVTRDQLTVRTITHTGEKNGKTVRAFSRARPGDMQDKRGWVLDLRAPTGEPDGERMVGGQVLLGSNLMAASMSLTEGGCGGNGKGYLNMVNAFTGGATAAPGFDVNGDGKLDADDNFPAEGGQEGIAVGSIDPGVGMATDLTFLLGQLSNASGNAMLSQACVSGASGTIGCTAVGWPPGFGRASWRELLRD